MPEYSPLKTLKKVGEAALEVATAVVISAAPQLASTLFDVLSNTPPETLHIPVQWAGFWILAVRGLRNYWKNRN